MRLQKKAIKNVFTLVCALSLGAALPTICQAGEVCPDNSSGPDICVAWDSGTPELGLDFTVDYATDAANPSVLLITGNLTWNVRSDNSGSPGNIGNLTMDWSGGPDDFVVSIDDSGGAGAANVASIILDDTLWNGYSSLIASKISGNLTGDLTVIHDGTTGGDLNFVIEGNASGDILAHTLSSLVVRVDVTATGTITATDMTCIEIDGKLAGSLTITGDTSGLLTVDTLTGSATFEGSAKNITQTDRFYAASSCSRRRMTARS